MDQQITMTRVKEKLKSFFESNRKRFSHGELRIAMGNEACDLDSFISSLVVAYAENAIHVVNMKKEVFITKGEIMLVCDRFGIDVDDLIYIARPTSHFSPKARKIGAYFDVGGTEHPISEKKITLLLTDHNKPIEELNDAEIELIIDHHALSSHVSPAKRIYIDLDVGSATTLVSKYLGEDLIKKNHCNLSLNKKIRWNEEEQSLCSSFAGLLLIPILMDTGFLKKRTSNFDISEYKKLKKISGLSEKELRKTIKALKSARKNDKEYETNLILQKDFKMFHRKDFTFGGSTVKYSFEDWVDREGKKISGFQDDEIGMALRLQIEQFRRTMGLDFFFVATKNKGVRNIIFSNFPFMKNLVSRSNLKAVEYKGLEYHDADKKLTRKVLVPEIMDIIDRHSDKDES